VVLTFIICNWLSLSQFIVFLFVSDWSLVAMNFMTSSVSSSNEWRKRRRFMDVSRPFVLKVMDSSKDVQLFEDSLFEELGIDAFKRLQFKAFLEEKFNLSFKEQTFLRCESLLGAFELCMTMPSFLANMDEQSRAANASLITIGVPLWIADKNLFVLKEGLEEYCELRYVLAKNAFGKEVVAFKNIVISNKETANTLISFAFAEIVRRDCRINVDDVPECRTFLSENPGWTAYISPVA
jgi:hypothetical protein